MKQQDLRKVYDTVILPGTEYCSVVYHSLIPDYLSKGLESVQKLAMSIIYGHGNEYSRRVSEGSIELLQDRREKAVREFALKNLESPRFKRWFPLSENGPRSVRSTTHRQYKEERCKTERMRNNPIQVMIRMLNEG